MKYSLQSLLFAVLAGVAIQAQAHDLCINPDGSLNDASVSKEVIAVDMLPACKDPGGKVSDGKNAGTVSGKESNPAAIRPADQAKAMDKRVALPLDCQTANGESRLGYIGATELLPVCTL